MISNIKYNKDEKWNQRFAGLIDGDGCFYINKKNEISFEITTHIKEYRILYNIKNKLKNGSIKLRSGSNSLRYRVKQINTIKNIVNRVQGKILNPARLKQFKRVCELLNINFIYPFYLYFDKVNNKENIKLDFNNSYLSGLFDSDGTITISVLKTSQFNSQQTGVTGKIIRLSESNSYNQLTIKITSIYKNYLLLLQNSYNLGTIYSEKINIKRKSPNIKYHWIIRGYNEVNLFCQYLNKNPLHSIKMHRVRLAPKYFFYKRFKYNIKSNDNIKYKIWLKFCKSWFKYYF